jgi:hypothetical protein
MGMIAARLSDEHSDVRAAAWSFFGTRSLLELTPCLPDLVGLLEHGEPTIQDAALSLLRKDPSLFQRVLNALSSEGARRARDQGDAAAAWPRHPPV